MLHNPTIDPEICPARATLAQTFNRHWIVVSLYSVANHCQQKALSSVEWLMAKVGDVGPALNRHWVECSVYWALCCRRDGR